MKGRAFFFALFALGVAGCARPSPSSNGSDAITLHVEIQDDVHDQTLFNDDVTVDMPVETLADFLEQAPALDAVLEDGAYGKTIMGLKGVETESFDKGPWWTYTSSNNDACQKTGVCDACGSLPIENGDAFTFTFSDTY